MNHAGDKNCVSKQVFLRRRLVRIYDSEFTVQQPYEFNETSCFVFCTHLKYMVQFTSHYLNRSLRIGNKKADEENAAGAGMHVAFSYYERVYCGSNYRDVFFKLSIVALMCAMLITQKCSAQHAICGANLIDCVKKENVQRDDLENVQTRF